MLATFLIDPDVFGGDDSASRPSRDSLRDAVTRFGIIGATNQDIVELLRRIQSYPGEYSRWREILLALPRVAPKCRPEACSSPFDLIRPSEDDCIAVFPPSRALQWIAALGGEVDSGAALTSDGRTEIICHDAVTRSSHLTKRYGWAQETLDQRAERAEVWRTRLAPLFRVARFVHIVDRYFFVSALDSVAPSANGPRWLCERVGELAMRGDEALSCTIYANLPDPPNDERAVLESLADELWELCRGAMRELRLVAGRSQHFNRIAHTRYLRFATNRTNRVVTIDNSLDVFRRRTIEPPVEFSYRVEYGSAAQGRADREAELEALCRINGGPVVRSQSYS